jgi:AcrR family transcriptional regulator
MTAMTTLSDARSALVRDRVIAAAVAALKSNADLTFARVASASGVPERTVYRYFATRSELLGAVILWLNQQVLPLNRPRTLAEVGPFVAQVFAMFDAHAGVVRAMLADPEGRRALLADNDARQGAALALVRHECPGMTAAAARRSAAIVQLLMSASAWLSFVDYWTLDVDEAALAATNAIHDVLTTGRLRSQRGRVPRR